MNNRFAFPYKSTSFVIFLIDLSSGQAVETAGYYNVLAFTPQSLCVELFLLSQTEVCLCGHIFLCIFFFAEHKGLLICDKVSSVR